MKFQMIHLNQFQTNISAIKISKWCINGKTGKGCILKQIKKIACSIFFAKASDWSVDLSILIISFYAWDNFDVRLLESIDFLFFEI